MAETQKATTGVKSQVWIEDSPGAGTFTKLHEVKSFGVPKPEREKYESTHLESDAKEFVPGDLDYGEFSIKVNYRGGSDTDARLQELAEGEDEIGVIFILAERGVLTRQYSGNMLVLAYGPDDPERSKVTEAEAKCQATGAFTTAAYTTPPTAA